MYDGAPAESPLPGSSQHPSVLYGRPAEFAVATGPSFNLPTTTTSHQGLPDGHFARRGAPVLPTEHATSPAETEVTSLHSQFKQMTK